jgi:hypothetical protein
MSDPAYSASALDDLKKKIAEKAIQRDLAEKVDWYGSADRGFQGGAWNEMLPPVTGPTGTMKLHFNLNAMSSSPGDPPPGATYLGEDFKGGMGQLFYVYEVDPWTDIYQPWIERIDAAFEGWDSLPDPGEYDGPINQLRSAVTALTPMPSPNGGPLSTDFTSVDLASNLSLLDHWVNSGTDGADNGLLVFAFDQAYGAARIQAVMQNQAQAGIVLGMSLLGEQRIWEKTRGDIMRLAGEAVKAFDITEGGGSISFDVVKAFIGLVGDFVPAPVKTVLTVGTDALSLVESLKPEEHKDDPHPDINGGDADEVYTSMSEAISRLDTTVFDQELELISHTLQGLLDEMRTHAGTQFHINPGSGVAPDLVHAKAIDVHPEYLKHIGYQTVPNIAAVMARAAEDADAGDRSGMWQRGGYIGYVMAGPYDTWKEVLAQFDAVTTGSAKELVEAGALLAQGAGFLQDTDGYSQAALKGVESEIARGKDSWDNSHVGAPPPPVPRGGPGHMVAV